MVAVPDVSRLGTGWRVRRASERLVAAVVGDADSVEPAAKRLHLYVRAFSFLAVAHAVFFAIFQVAFHGISDSDTLGDTVVAAGLTVAYLPLYVLQVRCRIQARESRWAGRSVAAITVVAGAGLLFLGPGWLPVLHVVAVSALLQLRLPWSVTAFVTLLASVAPLALVLGATGEWAIWYAYTVGWRALSISVVVWLVVVVRRLEGARTALADEAIADQRASLDDGLRGTVGASLRAIVERASGLAYAVPERARADLRWIAEESRRAGAEARRIAAGLRRPSVRAELEAAADLLSASGISVRIVYPARPLSVAAEERVRSELRVVVARALQHLQPTSCTITVSIHGGSVRVELRPDGTYEATGAGS